MDNFPQNSIQPPRPPGPMAKDGEQYQVPPLEPTLTGLNGPPHSPLKHTRGILVCLVFSALIGGYFVLARNQSWWPFEDVAVSIPTPTPNETADWQTYRNEDYGFEFKHPSTHTAYTNTDQKNEKLIPAGPSSTRVAIAEIEEHLFCCEAITLSFEFVPMVSAQEWPKYNAHGDKQSSIKFAGRDALQFIGTGSMDSIYRVILIDMLEALLVIKQTSQSNLLDQILSTFKFTR